MKKVSVIFTSVFALALLIGCSNSVSPSKQWTVTFADGDNIIATEEVGASDSGASVTAPSDVTKDGYVLMGWSSDSSDNDVRIKESANRVSRTGNTYIITVYTDDVVLNPIWEPGHIVTFKYGEGAEGEQATVTVSDGGEIPSEYLEWKPQRDGYSFVEWDSVPNSVTEDVVINAVYEEIPTWNVDFTDGQGNILKTDKVEEGKSALPPTNPTRDGYTFNGWDTDYKTITSDLTVNATWKIEPTVGMSNALSKAQSYLRSSSFSYEGLVEQLEFEQFTHDEAVYGVDNCGADWNEQAAKKAQSYLRSSSFSRGGLYDQLLFEGFTPEQAEYGVSAVGL